MDAVRAFYEAYDKAKMTYELAILRAKMATLEAERAFYKAVAEALELAKGG